MQTTIIRSFVTAILFAFCFQSLMAIPVTFRVDVSGNTVTSTGVHMAGNLITPNWTPNATPLTDMGNDIWEVTIDIAPQNMGDTPYEFKFLLGDDWSCSCDELGGQPNRTLFVPQLDAVVLDYTFNTVPSSTNANFTVDASNETVSANGMHIAGAFLPTPWTPMAGPMSDNGDGTWTYTLPGFTGSGEYKTLTDNDWGCGCDELQGQANRYVEAPMADNAAFLFTFNQFAPASAINVTFQVDMNNETVSANGVSLGSNTTTPMWTPSANPMFDDGTNGDVTAGDGIYSLTVTIDPSFSGDMEWKFVNDNDWGNNENFNDSEPCVANGNRSMALPSQDTVLDPVCYNSCDACPTGAGVSVTFTVDVGCETVGAAGVQIAGSFLTPVWTPGANPMTDMGNGIWSITLNDLTPGVMGEYKFLLDDFFGSDESVPGACGLGLGNRVITIPDADTVLDTPCFGECGPCVAGTVDVTFRVNTTGFSVSPNGVHMAGNFEDVILGAGLTNPNGYPNWTPSGIPLTEVEPDCWEVTIEGLPECNSLEYKYLLDNDWACGCDEFQGQPNRMLNIPQGDVNGSAVLPRYVFNSTDVASIDVVLQVDMNNETIDPAGVFVEGAFTNIAGFASWGTGNPMFDDGTNGDQVAGDGVYSTTIPNFDLVGMEFKFTNGAGGYEPVSGPGAFGNRILDPACGNGLILQPTVCFGVAEDGACPVFVDATFTLCLGDLTPDGIFGITVSGQGPNGESPFFAQMMPADCNCFTATTTVQAGVDYSYAYTNGSGEATPRPNFSVTGPTVLPTAYFDGNGQVPMGTIQRQGALFGEYFTTTTGGEVYTWCDEDGDVVAQFVGNNHFTPSELGTYTLKISTPDCPSGSGAQLFSPYTITTLDGCCDGILLDNIGN